MKYFTPELYLRFNSADNQEADQANEEWEKALRDYERHLEQFRKNLPARVKELADQRCFHDAELLLRKEPGVEHRVEAAPLILGLKQEKEIVIIVYLLWDRVRLARAPKGWKFSPKMLHWLYDEVDIDSRRSGRYWQRVLLSDGRVMEIPFSDVFIQDLPLASLAAPVRKRKLA